MTEQDAVYFQRLAQVLAAYAQKTQLRSIRVESGVVSAQAVNGKVLIPLFCDYGIWSEQNADRFNGFAKAVQSDSDVKGLVVWVDGKISDDARQQLKQRNVEVTTEVPTKGTNE